MVFRYTISFLLTILFSINVSASEGLMKKRVLSDLDVIHNIFEVKYAPLKWKEEFANWNLDKSIGEAKQKIISKPSPSIKECQTILRDFFNSTRDYHASIRFFSTESAMLPFLIKGAKGRYFITYVDRSAVSTEQFPFEPGDEILQFGSQPIHKAVQELRTREFGANTAETDQALAELALTFRRGDLGYSVPSGAIVIKGKHKNTSNIISCRLHWDYMPEKIKDFSKLGRKATINCTAQCFQGDDLQQSLKTNKFFEKHMVCPIFDKTYVGSSNKFNNHTVGARVSYIPSLGKKVWKSDVEAIFDAYIFETGTQDRVGYIRIPHYIGDVEEVEEFGEIMNYFQENTDALVIDQINNPGGSLWYVYGLASTLANNPLYTPKHRIALTQEEVFMAYSILPNLDGITDDSSARMAFGDTFGGYPVTYEFAGLMKRFCRFVIDQWEAGKIFSDPTFLFGIDEIKPHPDYRYTKPILLLVNSLDFSAGDFFPSILKDNKRAIVMGTRTAGAGGYVIDINVPSHCGIKSFSLTGSLALGMDQKPLENLGITPDIFYEISVMDLQNHYQEYVSAINSAIEALIADR